MYETAIATLNRHISRIRVPNPSDKVYKDECVYSFDTPDSDTGLYICLQTFFGLGRDYIEKHYNRTGCSVYLHIRRDRIEKEDKQKDGPERKVTKLAIGIEGGFEPDKKNVEVTETLAIIVLPDFSYIPWPCTETLPDIVIKSVQGVLNANSATKLAELESAAGTWDGEVRMVSKHAGGLVQLENGVKVPPDGWKCDMCLLDANLWLNLTDGKILCGRKFFDGSGGNEHALQHYKTTGYPLAVKLGTITKEGKGDVFSYEEDDMVEDPHLIQHLAHFGINIQNLEKTEKSMAELEVALNSSYREWSGAEEGEVVTGPGLTGLANMGNSCYLNSVLQILFSIPDFKQKYYYGAEDIFNNASDPATDFNVQMAKLGVAIFSGKYSRPETEGQEKKIYPPITPHMFKTLVGRGHPDFSTKHQQDAHEYFLHLLTTVQRNCRGESSDPTDCFKLNVEDRFECGTTGKVKYTKRTEYCLPLSIPLSQEQLAALKAPSHKSFKDSVRPQVSFDSCISTFLQTEIIEQFYSTAIQDKTTAKKTTRLATFPDYLLIHLKKFTLREDWTPIKLDVGVDIPLEMDLKRLRSEGRRPDEELLPDPAGPIPTPAFQQEMVNVLMEQGFPLEAVKRALYFTKGAGLEAAVNWLMEHIADEDISDPFVVPGTESSSNEFVPNEDGLAMLTAMGFTRAQATKALKATGNNVERAGDWIFSHADELDQAELVETTQQQTPPGKFRDGNSVYRLVGFISHMGPSSMVGHYVCHILHEGRWVLYNDEKVAYVDTPPKNLGYLYLYQRC